MRTTPGLLSAMLFLTLPDLAPGQTLSCDMKLSGLEASLAESEKRAAQVIEELTAFAEAIGQIENDTFQSARCPEGTDTRLAGHTSALSKIDVQGLVEKAAVHLRCTQFFSARVEQDLLAAAEQQKADLILRLSQISKRILEADAAATKQYADALFLTSKIERLHSGLRTIEGNCNKMSTIYE